MEKPICLITGATEGVGKATVIELARKGFAVVLAARDAEKAQAVKEEVIASTANPDVDYIIADLRSLNCRFVGWPKHSDGAIRGSMC